MMTTNGPVTGSNEFEIYQSDAGYVAVTNEVRRKILGALLKKERQLNELVKITGKAKPTLSNLHMKELLQQGLIEELPHPTDARKKVYRIKGQRIGSSNVPIEQLRGAVKRYVSLSPLAHAIPLQQVLDVLLAAGPKAHEPLHRQATKLGEITGALLTAPDLRELIPRVGAYWEREGVSRTARIDLEHLALEVDINPRYAGSKEALKLTATLLGGILQGVACKLDPKLTAKGEVVNDRIRVSIDAP